MTGKDLDEKIEAERQLNHVLIKEAQLLKNNIEAFETYDVSKIPNMSKQELADFQTSHHKDSPQFVLALNEWNRRLVKEQVKATRFAALIGLLGVILGAILTYSFSMKTKNNKEDVDNNPSQNHHGNQPDEVTIESFVEPEH